MDQVRVDYFRYIKQPLEHLYILKQFPCRYYRKRGFKNYPEATPATKGGTTKAYVDINGTTYLAEAKCHPGIDNFSYRLGRTIAIGRLRKLLESCVARGKLSSVQVENVLW